MFRPSKFFVVLLVLIFATAAFAFAASNTFAVGLDPRAGDGVTGISGYEITDVDYNLNSTNPYNIDSVDITLDAPANSVSIGLVTGGVTYSCTGGGTSWNCVTSGATVSAANNLRVIAAE